MPLLLALALAIALAACVFAIQNADVITVSFLAWRWQASLALVLLATFALGALVGLLSCFSALVRGRVSEGRLSRRLRELEGAGGKEPPPGSPGEPPAGPAP